MKKSLSINKFHNYLFPRKLIMLSSCMLIALYSVTAANAEVNAKVNVIVKTNTIKQPTQYTLEKNNQVANSLDLDDQKEFAEARRGLIAAPKDLKIASIVDPNELAWNGSDYDFIKGDAPTTVNPSLWRQAKLNNIIGLFEVTPGIYQIRGFDIANMTLVKGDTGWIVIDTLSSKETASFAFDFAMKNLSSKYPNFTNVSAILFTHSHLDHFGGVQGIISEEEVIQKNIPVVAPFGFMEEATSENIIVGPAMLRRSAYMYGMNLDVSEYGHVSTGLGITPSIGQAGVLTPNILISESVTTLDIDGVEFQFQYTPDSEAPAEFVFYIPKYKAYGGAEVVSRNMHNLYTLRGAKVRDALKWSNYIEQSRNLFGEAEVYFGSHQWPIWGRDNIQTFLKQQRDTYKFIHDQTVRRMNKGMNPGEIADDIAMPDTLEKVFSSRGYYGTLKHNSRAVYQNYLGWFDANPAHLDPLPDPQRAIGYVKLAGGSDKLFYEAKIAFDKGEYRWAAELLNHLVYAEPNNTPARELLARTYDQLGYQAESGPWRDFYLTGAQELREGVHPSRVLASNMRDQFLQTPIPELLTTLSVSLKAEEAANNNLRIIFDFTDINESYLIWIENSVFHFRPLEGDLPPKGEVDAILHMTHPEFIDFITATLSFKEFIASDGIHMEGDPKNIIQLFSLFESPDINFAIVTAD